MRVNTKTSAAAFLALAFLALSSAAGWARAAAPASLPSGDNWSRAVPDLVLPGPARAGPSNPVQGSILRAAEEARRRQEAERHKDYAVTGGLVAVGLIGTWAKSRRRRS